MNEVTREFTTSTITFGYGSKDGVSAASFSQRVPEIDVLRGRARAWTVKLDH